MCSGAQSPSIKHDEIDAILRHLWQSQEEDEQEQEQEQEQGDRKHEMEGEVMSSAAAAVEIAALKKGGYAYGGCGGESWGTSM